MKEVDVDAHVRLWHRTEGFACAVVVGFASGCPNLALLAGLLADMPGKTGGEMPFFFAGCLGSGWPGCCKNYTSRREAPIPCGVSCTQKRKEKKFFNFLFLFL